MQQSTHPVDPFLDQDLKWILEWMSCLLLIPYLHFPSMSIAQFLVHLIWWRICHPQITIHIKWHIKQGWEKKKRSSSLWVQEKKNKTGETEQGAKASKWKSFTCHEASGSWSLHSTMSCIQLCMHSARVTGRCWKTSVVMSQEFYIYKKKRWCSQIYATQAMLPCACIPLENSSSRSPHPLLWVPHPISKSIICVCEAEEAHHLTTAPPPFFPPLSSCCHRASQPPC